jgi:hypothetical protein
MTIAGVVYYDIVLIQGDVGWKEDRRESVYVAIYARLCSDTYA